ncbi:TetR/AcrR family transcriptional regulator C-terminal ligand-binding domain-containing protein [Streptomyces cocklensis]|nr:TetR/AcrR family transcriptional regulator C-terminal ligand-binding domain-containing protein [Actinacidiphila cocklensis]
MGDDVLARTVWERLILPRLDNVRVLLARARERGELTREDDDFLIDLVFSPMWYRLLFDRAALNAAYAGRLSAAVTALAARPERRGHPLRSRLRTGGPPVV